jgi:hypothetical protein
MKRSGGDAGRPLGHLTVPDLEILVSQSQGQSDELKLVLSELGHRKSKRAGELAGLVTRLLDEPVKKSPNGDGPLFDKSPIG